LNFTFKPSWGSVRIGRQAITWGNGLIFNPMDLFNPFPPADIQRDYKVGDDMALAQVALPYSADLQLLYVVRRDPDTNNVEADRNSLAGLLHFSAGTTEFDVMATRHFDDYVVGPKLPVGCGQHGLFLDLVGQKFLRSPGVLLQRSG
jgi:hypothetical protein